MKFLKLGICLLTFSLFTIVACNGTKNASNDNLTAKKGTCYSGTNCSGTVLETDDGRTSVTDRTCRGLDGKSWKSGKNCYPIK